MPYNTEEDNRMFDNLDAAIRRNQELLDEQTAYVDDDGYDDWMEAQKVARAKRQAFEDNEQAEAIQAGDGNCLFTLLFFLAVGVNLVAQVWV